MIPFKTIPANQRAPLFYGEIDNSRANTDAFDQRALLIGQMSAAGTLVPNVPVQLLSSIDGRAAAGPGSVLAGMIDAYRAADPNGELWVLPIADDAAAAAAAGAVVFAGATTVAGTLPLYVAGRSIPVALASGTTAAQVATLVAAAITAASGIPATAVVDGVNTAKVNLTARNKGAVGNDLDIRFAYKGTAGGEAIPAGLTATVTAMAGGATNPSIVMALANLLDMPFDFIVSGLNDAVSLAAIANLLNDQTGRWSYASQTYGHCWYGYRGTAGQAAAQATALNNQHLTQVPFADSPSPFWKWAAAFAGASAVSLRADPGVPLQYLTVPGILAPPLASRWSLAVRNNTLLWSGSSSWTVDADGNVVTENIVTTYVVNAQGQADDSYLEVETLFLLMYVLRNLRATFMAQFSRVKLAADGVRLAQGANVVTPSTIRAALIASYREMEADGMVQGSDAFAAGLQVRQNAQNPNRVDILYPGILVDQLRVVALLFQFRLAASA
jgi:phage tail sheath gpL-like